jgi:hypothetical protein
MELIASILDFLFGILYIDWRKLAKKERPKQAGPPAPERSTFLFVLVYLFVFALAVVAIVQQ